VTDQVLRLFGEAEWDEWSGTIARAALYTLTDEHIRHAESAATTEAMANRRRAETLGDVAGEG
jgi:hypothetical protein